MGTHKKFSGYESFAYLERGKDFKAFELVEGLGPFEPYLIPLSQQEESRVEKLAEQTVMISLHEQAAGVARFRRFARRCRRAPIRCAVAARTAARRLSPGFAPVRIRQAAGSGVARAGL